MDTLKAESIFDEIRNTSDLHFKFFIQTLTMMLPKLALPIWSGSERPFKLARRESSNKAHQNQSKFSCLPKNGRTSPMMKRMSWIYTDQSSIRKRLNRKIMSNLYPQMDCVNL